MSTVEAGKGLLNIAYYNKRLIFAQKPPDIIEMELECFPKPGV